MYFYRSIPSLALVTVGIAGAVAMRRADLTLNLAPAAVAVVVSLDEGYQGQMSEVGCLARCLEVTNALRDTLQHLLADTHGYAQWTIEGAPTDTLELRWSDPEPPFLFKNAHLAFVMRGSSWAGQQDSIMELFETFVERDGRRNRPGAWAAAAVRRDWAPRLHALLIKPRVQSDVFFRLPIAARAPVAKLGDVRVFITPSALGTSGDRASSPQFDLRVTVQKDADATWRYDGDLRLMGCLNRSPRQVFYDCQAVRLTMGDRILEGAELTALRSASTITTRGVRLARFQPVAAPQRLDTTQLFPE